MNTNHSPAPWSIRGDILRDANGVLLYRLTPLDEITIAQDDANRALIEAGPEMAEALRRLETASRADYALAYCGPQEFTEEQREELRMESARASMEARAVLAKLEGSP